MRHRNRLAMLSLAIVLVAAVGGASVASAAPGSSPLAVVQAAVANLQVQIQDLGVRLGLVESDVVSLDSRVDVLEAGGAGGEFGPEVASATPVVGITAVHTQYSSPWGTSEYWSVETTSHVLLEIPGYPDRTEEADVVVVTVDAGEWGTQAWGNQRWFTADPAYALEPGTPITIEYWYDHWGYTLHDTITYTDWVYEDRVTTF